MNYYYIWETSELNDRGEKNDKRSLELLQFSDGLLM